MKYIFLTGGVVSSLGKGLTAASLGTLLESRGLKVALQKFDPYLNVDPGTMSPFQHGEVYVLDDGALDLLVDARDAGPTHTVAQPAAPAVEIAAVDMPEAARSYEYLQSLAEAQKIVQAQIQKNPDSDIVGKQFGVTQETSNLAVV